MSHYSFSFNVEIFCLPISSDDNSFHTSFVQLLCNFFIFCSYWVPLLMENLIFFFGNRKIIARFFVRTQKLKQLRYLGDEIAGKKNYEFTYMRVCAHHPWFMSLTREELKPQDILQKFFILNFHVNSELSTRLNSE